jgi:hypothetical protein
VWATCVMAIAIGGCSSDARQRSDAGPSSDTLPGGDTMPSSDAVPPDHPGADGGPNDLVIGADGAAPCFVPTDCPAGMSCCLVFTSGGGVVVCQASALCVGDGVSTLIACATATDCPVVAPNCVPVGSTPGGRELNVCSSP